MLWLSETTHFSVRNVHPSGVVQSDPTALLQKYPESCMCVLGPHGSAAPCPLPVTGTLDTLDGLRFVVSLCSLAGTTSGTIPRFSQTPLQFALGGDVFSCFSLMIPPVWMIKVCIFFFNVIWFDCLISFPPIF